MIADRNDAIKDDVTGIAINPRFAKRNSFVVRSFPSVKAWYIPIAVDRNNIIPNTAKSTLPNCTISTMMKVLTNICPTNYGPLNLYLNTYNNVVYETLKSLLVEPEHETDCC